MDIFEHLEQYLPKGAVKHLIRAKNILKYMQKKEESFTKLQSSLKDGKLLCLFPAEFYKMVHTKSNHHPL